MNRTEYVHLLIDSVCNLAEMDSEALKAAYDKMEVKPDNFDAGYPVRYILSDGKIDGLGELLEVFYGNTFKYEESTYCEGYGKLIEFLYAIDIGEDCDVNEIVERLDDLTNENALFDIEGEKINDDDDIRIMRNVNTLFGLKQLLNGDTSEESIWQFMNADYRDHRKVMRLLEESKAGDADEILSEWLVCSEGV